MKWITFTFLPLNTHTLIHNGKAKTCFVLFLNQKKNQVIKLCYEGRCLDPTRQFLELLCQTQEYDQEHNDHSYRVSEVLHRDGEPAERKTISEIFC